MARGTLAIGVRFHFTWCAATGATKRDLGASPADRTFVRRGASNSYQDGLRQRSGSNHYRRRSDDPKEPLFTDRIYHQLRNVWLNNRKFTQRRPPRGKPEHGPADDGCRGSAAARSQGDRAKD
jgi:hypothetical protein